VAAIHWQALRLRLKGARLVPRPVPRPVPGEVPIQRPRPHAAPADRNTVLATDQSRDYTGAALSAAGREPGARESALVQ